MIMRRVLFLIITTALSLPVFSDAVVFHTDFSELPEHWWSNSEWEFGSGGAVTSNTWPSTYWDADMFSGDGPPDIIYFIPDGTDSVLITIPYYVHADVSEGDANFRIRIKATGSDWTEIWSRAVYYQGSITESGTISIVPDWISGGEWMGIFFDAWGSCIYVGCLETDWQIHSLTITAMGDSLVLDQTTWANIKAYQGE